MAQCHDCGCELKAPYPYQTCPSCMQVRVEELAGRSGLQVPQIHEMSEQESTICAVCGGVKRVDWTISFEKCYPVEMRFDPATLAENGRLCPGHPEPAQMNWISPTPQELEGMHLKITTKDLGPTYNILVTDSDGNGVGNVKRLILVADVDVNGGQVPKARIGLWTPGERRGGTIEERAIPFPEVEIDALASALEEQNQAILWEIAQGVADGDVMAEQAGACYCIFCGETQLHGDEEHTPNCIVLKARRVLGLPANKDENGEWKAS